jgi:hypothetical protein
MFDKERVNPIMNHNSMAKRSLAACKWLLIGSILLLFCVKAMGAEDEERNTASLFLSTSPIRARVLIDDSPLIHTTPLLLQDISPGKHRIAIVKKDYQSYFHELEFSSGEIKTVHIDLEQQSFDTSFPSEQRIVFGGRKGSEIAEVYRLPHGRYAFRVENGDLFVDPVFPDDGLITALNISIPVCVAVSALLTANDLLFPPESGLLFSPTTLSAYGITATVISLDVAMHVRKRRYLQEASQNVQESRRAYHLAGEYYDKGQQMLAQNRMPEALDYYTWIIQNCRDSLLFPYALYQIAKIHLIQGESELAFEEFELIATQFPLSDLYDKSLKALADLHYRAGRYQKSLELLDSMVFLDPLYSREEIERYRREIRAKSASQ